MGPSDCTHVLMYSCIVATGLRANNRRFVLSDAEPLFLSSYLTVLSPPAWFQQWRFRPCPIAPREPPTHAPCSLAPCSPTCAEGDGTAAKDLHNPNPANPFGSPSSKNRAVGLHSAYLPDFHSLSSVDPFLFSFALLVHITTQGSALVPRPAMS
jgi:hypothetical protein